MVMTLENVVPFGRSLNEYRRIFNLSDTDLDGNLVGIGDGPASFNAEMYEMGKRVVSIDPLYIYGGKDIEGQLYEVVDDIISQVKQTPDDWVWSYHNSADHLKENRVKVLNTFLEDYKVGRKDGRYVVGELPWSALRALCRRLCRYVP